MIFWVVREVKGQKVTQNDEKLCVTLYFRNHIPCLHLWYACIKDNISRHFFYFFKILISRTIRWVKGKKMVQITKNDTSCSISQEPYIIWLSFIVHMCKMMISPVIFLNFSKFWFSGLSGKWKGKKWPKMTVMCCTLWRSWTFLLREHKFIGNREQIIIFIRYFNIMHFVSIIIFRRRNIFSIVLWNIVFRVSTFHC